ncbi:MAG: molybdopterin-dependent oxidoreductase [Sandaracinaceae bacterium]
MSAFADTFSFLGRLLDFTSSERRAERSETPSADPLAEKMKQPVYTDVDAKPVSLLEVKHPDGRMSRYPPPEKWDDWVEWDSKAWPKKVARRYTLVPTICFNCESACGLLAYVDKETYEIRRFEGNPAHPGSRGRNCAKGPATHNQVYDPERILYPLKRVGARGEGKWKRVTWEEALTDIGTRMRESRQKRLDGIMYHVGRPGEDHFANRAIQAWGVDGHNSHTNICSAAARCGYHMWSGGDRPSPDFSEAEAILLISAHLESGHYFNPHAQRILEGKHKGAKLIVLDPRLSNTAARADCWLPTWPGSETAILLSIARHLIENDLYDKGVRRALGELGRDARLHRQKWAKDWRSSHSPTDARTQLDADEFTPPRRSTPEFTFERAAEEAQVPIERLRKAAGSSAAPGKPLAHTPGARRRWATAAAYQIARALFFLNVLTGSVGTAGGTSLNSWNKFVPKSYRQPPAFDAWNELHLPHEYPFAFYEMSFCLPHFLEEAGARSTSTSRVSATRCGSTRTGSRGSTCSGTRS